MIISHWLVQKPLPAKNLTVYVKADNWGPSGFVARQELAYRFATRERAETVAKRHKGFVAVAVPVK